MRRPTLFGLLLFTAACSSAAAPDRGPVSSTDPTNAVADEPAAPPSGAPSAPSAPPATPVTPAPSSAPDRPAPSGSGIRDCGSKLTAPKPLVTTVTIPKTRAVTLGGAVVDGVPSTDVWITGTPKLSEGTEAVATAGADPSPGSFAGMLGRDTWNTFVDADPIGGWADGLAATSTRMTFGIGGYVKEFGVLVRDGATLSLAILASSPRPDVDALVKASTCSTADLAACAALVKALGPSNPSRSSDVAELQAGSDPDWVAARYETRELVIVP